MLDLLPYLAAAVIYLAVAASRWHRAAAAMPRRHRLEHAAIAVGLALHGAVLTQDALLGPALNFGISNALSAILWLTVLIYWLASLRHDLHAMQAFVLPPAALFVLLQKLAPVGHAFAYTGDAWFGAHLVIALLAYSLFTFAALHAGLMAFAERSLHHRGAAFRLPDFPPLMPMERLLFQVIGLGFVLLTLTVVSGIFFSEHLFQTALQWNHKNIFSLLAWLVFGALLAGRRVYGWRGRTAIRWTLAGFGILLLAYLGSKFVLEIILGR